jgi:hypothetical protein
VGVQGHQSLYRTKPWLCATKIREMIR